MYPCRSARCRFAAARRRAAVRPPGGPVPARNILLVEAAAVAADSITGTLGRLGYNVTTVTDPEGAVQVAPSNDLVILDVVGAKKTAVDVARGIRAAAVLSGIPILAISQTDSVEERIEFLEAGADDVMPKPFDERELEARVDALLLRVQRARDLAPPPALDGTLLPRVHRVVAVFSPKGGVGTTTIATNIAVAQAQRKPDNVVLVDLNLGFGSVATHLNLDVRNSLADVIRDEAALREPELLASYAIRHESGLSVLAAPPTPELAATVEPHHVEQLLETLVRQYDAIVVDAGSMLDERTMIVLDRADSVIVPFHPEMAALKAVKAMLDYLNENGSNAAKTSFVVNNTFAREILRMRDVETALGARVALELPYDAFLYLKAVNEGVPIVQGAPRSIPADLLVRLSASAFNEDGETAPAAADRTKGLTGLLRRS
jgi:pilus assembly protein CpaE